MSGVVGGQILETGMRFHENIVPGYEFSWRSRT